MQAADPRHHLPLIAALLAGGLLLTVLSQPLVSRETSALSLGLSAGGVVLFLAGAGAARWPAATAAVAARLAPLAAAWRITPAQAALLPPAVALALVARAAAGDGLKAHLPLLAVGAWLLAIAIALLAWWCPEERPALARRDLFGILGLTLGAVIVRVVGLEQLPTTLSGDEASAGLSALAFVTGDADNVFSIGWFSFPSLFYALQSGPLMLFGRTAFALRLLTAITGALTVAGVYALGRALFDRATAAIAAALLLAGHYHIHFSRIGLQNTWDGLFLVLVLIGLWTGWQTGRRAPFLLAGVALGAGQYFYVAFRLVPVAVAVWAVAAAIVQPRRFRQRLPDLVGAAFIATVVCLPLALYFVANPLEFNAPLQRVSLLANMPAQVAATGSSPLRLIATQLTRTAAGLTHLPLLHWYTPGTALLRPAAAALFLLGVLWSVLHIDLRVWLLLLPVIGVVVSGGLSLDAPASQRYVMAATIAPLFVARPLVVLHAYLQRLWPGRRAAWRLGLALIVGALAASDLDFYFRRVYGEHGYVLGGANTETAHILANHLRTVEAPHDVVFLGWPRMGYASIATVPFLAPQHNGIDIWEPLTTVPTAPLQRPTLFVALPERSAELAYIQRAYPGGTAALFQAHDAAYFIIYSPPE